MEPTTLEEVRQAASRVDAVCLLAPIPTPENLGDGYIRRIDTIDNTILKSFVRIYLMGDRPDLRRIQAEKEDERRYFLQFDSRSCWQRRQIFDLIRRSGRLYIHSVYRFVAGPVSRRLLKVLDLPGIRVVWDVHGAVPEEIEQTGDIPITLRAAEAEQRLYQKSSDIVCVTMAMEEHLRGKYGETGARMRLLPILPDMTNTVPSVPPPASGKPTVVYAGGLQGWQCVDAMIQLIDKTWDRYDYRFYTSDPDALMARWGPGEGKNHITAACIPPEEMDRAYRGCQYGLLLREDSPINAVACPTKLMEYIVHGLVPVLKSTAVGDVEAMGLGYITLEALENGRLLSEAERRTTAENNLAILRKTAEGIWRQADAIMI